MAKVASGARAAAAATCPRQETLDEPRLECRESLKGLSAIKYTHVLRGLASQLCPHISHCFARVYATTPHLSSSKACTITMESDTSPHVLRFTGFDHRRERRRLE